MESRPRQALHFCRTPDGVGLAYAVSGHGPPLVKTANWMTHLDHDARSPVWAPWLEAFARGATLLRYDARGCGLSDRGVTEFSLDAWVSDLETVVEAAGLAGPFDLFGMSQGGPVAVAYAARHPARVRRLVLYGAYARGQLRRGLGAEHEDEARALLDVIRVGWGRDNPAFRQLFTSLFLPGGTPEQMAWFNELERLSATPDTAAALVGATYEVDVTDEAGRVRAPTLVLHARGDARVPVGEGRVLAALIPGARFVELDSANHVLLEHEPAWPRFLRELAEFLESPALAAPEPGRAAAPGRDAPGRDSAAPHAAVPLTARERDVVALVRRGWTNKRIARELGLSPKTVRNYVSTVLAKLGANTRAELAGLAREDDLPPE